jgi:hypothetical protein
VAKSVDAFALNKLHLFQRITASRQSSPRTEEADAAPDDDADDGKAQEQEAEAEAMDEEVTEDETRDADAKHCD